MKLTTLYRKYNGARIQDDGGVTSKEFRKFASDVRKTLGDICSEIGAELHNFRPGHYDLSAFIKKDGKYCYVSYSVPRGEAPVDMDASDAMFGWLYRTASSTEDYTGGRNHFCNTLSLQTCISICLDE